jgi:hypothetical protein
MPRVTGTVLGKDGQPLNGVTVRLARADTGAALGSAVTGDVSGYADSVLHVPLESSFADVSPIGATGTSIGGAAISNTHPLPTGESTLFMGGASGRRLVYESRPEYAIGAGDYTIDISIYPTSNIFGPAFELGVHLDGLIIQHNGIFSNAEGYFWAWGNSVSLNQWNYIRLKRTGGQISLFINGVQFGASVADATNLAAGKIDVGGREAGSFVGSVSHLRLVIGEALAGGGQIAPLLAAPPASEGGFFSISTAHTDECHRVIQSPYGDRNHLVAKVTPGGA